MHFHILWNGENFDWEPHKTRTAAEKRARELARPGESYSIKGVRDEGCETCDAIAANSVLGDD